MILAAWLWGAVSIIWAAKKDGKFRRLLGFIGGTCMGVGAIGFFGTALVSMVDWLPGSFEWPIGFTKGVVATSDHYFIVPHTPSGRVQVYDESWKFIRGWHVDARSGTFKLNLSDTNHIHVITARGNMHYVFDLEGNLLSADSYPSTGYSSFPSEGRAYAVPTPIWLWAFSRPFHSWLVALVGVVLIIARDKFPRREVH